MYIDVTNNDRKKINETNLRNGSSIGSTRSIGSKQEDSLYKIGSHAMAEGQGTAASGIASHAEGMESQSGSKAFTIVGVDKNNKTYTLDSIEGLSVGDVYSAHVLYTTGASSQAENYGKIIAINENVVTVDNLWCEGEFATSDSYISGGYDGEKNTFRIIAKPNVGTRVIGDISHAEGVSTKALGKGSHAEGKGTVAHGSWSHAEGNNTKAGYGAHAEGSGTIASGFISHAEGENTTSSDWASHAEGSNTTASGGYSHAEGKGTKSIALMSHAEGDKTTASGLASHAEGGNATTASGDYSHAEGFSTKSIGQSSHTEGKYTNASGDCSHAEGFNTKATGLCSHVQGKYNIVDNNNKYSNIVGNGYDSTHRSNAHTLDWEGNAWYAGDVYVGSTSGTNKDAGSKKVATEEYVVSAVASTGSNMTPNLENRYILFIGDSYAGNWTANNNVGWIEALNRQIASTLGIGLETDEWKTFRNTHYAAISKGGIGFSAGIKDVENGPYLNVFDRLNNFISNNQAFMSKVTDVVFALGYNDAAKAVSSASSTYDDIKEKINLCNTLINNNTSHYVNKYLFAVGWGSNPSVRWHANSIYKSVYSYSAELGWIYSDIRYIMYDSDLYYKDWVHPNMNGSTKIASRILNTLLGNSSIVNCEDKYYTTTTSKGTTVNVGYLNVVNNELAQFFFSSVIIYDGSLVTVPKYGTQEICEITGFVPFGATSPVLFSNCSFHIVDTVNNTENNVMLSCCVIKKLEGLVEGHNKYKSYLYIKNTTDSEIKFNKLAPNNGVISIVPHL